MMKKLIVSLLVLAMALSAVSAAVDFSGELVSGYAFQYNTKTDTWTNHIMGQDGEDTNTTLLNLSIADENGIWNVGIEGYLYADESGGVAGDIGVDIAKLFSADTEWTAKLNLNVNDRLTGLRAYSMQKNLDRIRTAQTGLWTSLTLGYGDLAQVMIGGSPATVAIGEDGDFNYLPANEGDFMVSALVNPIEGISVSATYALKGDALDSGIDKVGTENFADGLVGGSAAVDVAELIGLDYSLGFAVSEKYDIGGKNNIFAAAVYGAFDPVGFQLQYGLKNYGDDTTEHFVYAGVDVTAIENMLLDAYFGAYNAAEFAKSWFVGGDVGYTLSNVTFKLGLEYGAGTSYNYDDSYYATTDKGAGFWIVPSVSVAW